MVGQGRFVTMVILLDHLFAIMETRIFLWYCPLLLVRTALGHDSLIWGLVIGGAFDNT